MKSKINSYWLNVRGLEQSLPDITLLTSIEDRSTGSQGGVVTPASRFVAAQRIADGSHREATAEEAAAYFKDQADRKAKAHADSLRQAGKVVITIPAPRPVVAGKKTTTPKELVIKKEGE